MKEDGLYLSLSHITAAHQGRYVCLVNETNMDILSRYDITVTGGKHALMCILVIRLYLLRNQHGAQLSCACGLTSNHLAWLFL